MNRKQQQHKQYIEPQRNWEETATVFAISIGLALAALLAAAPWLWTKILRLTGQVYSYSLPDLLRDVFWLARNPAYILHYPYFTGFIGSLLLLATSLAWLAAWLLCLPPPASIHISGRNLEDNRDAHKLARQEMLDECSISGEGIYLTGDIPISLDRETRHIFVLGSVGGGKTQIILPMMRQAIERGDKVLIYDNKADFGQYFNGVRFAPWDARSVAWNISADCLNRGDARATAARLIADSHDPVWSNGARQILVALIVLLQRKKPRKWTFADLVEVACVPFGALRDIVLTYNPEAVRIVEDYSKTAQSFLVNLSSYLSPICDLADCYSGKKRFSVRNWLLDDTSGEYKCNTIILGGNRRYAPVEKAYVQSILSALGSLVNSPELPDSRDRRIWLFLDEFSQLGKLDDFAQFLEIGRSKGIRVVLGAQDVAQLRNIYGKDTVDAWTSMIGTYIICRTQGVETPEWLSRLVGEKTIKRYMRTRSIAEQSEGVKNASMSYSYEHVREPVIQPEDFATLGPTEKGIQALFVPGGGNIFSLTFPFANYPREYAPIEPAEQPEASAKILQQSYLSYAASASRPRRTNFGDED